MVSKWAIFLQISTVDVTESFGLHAAAVLGTRCAHSIACSSVYYLEQYNGFIEFVSHILTYTIEVIFSE